MAWLDENDLDGWVEAIDDDGETLGWMRIIDAHSHDIPIINIETPKRFLMDPYVLYHAKMAYERGLLNRGRDLNDVQTVLLASCINKRQEREAKLREQAFEENLLINNPDGYKAYMQRKREMEAMEVEDGVVIEEQVPQNIEEFLSTLSAFSEAEDLDSDKEQTIGWLSSFLDDEDLEELGDD